jgi:mono/diheme cytochrome c family protein
MKLFKLLLPLISMTLSAFLVQAQDVSKPSLVGEGAKIYSENCGRCHNPRPAEEYTKKEWSVVIPHMRAKAHMTGKEALAVEAFLASTLTSDVQNQVSADSLKNKPQRSGEELIAGFGCQGCHKINGTGGALGGDLTGVVNKRGAEFIIKKLTDPTFNNQASSMPKFPMTEEDKKMIVEFLAKQ